MRSMVKWFAPVVALGLLVGFSATKAVAADDDAKGSVSGTVTGTDGQPAAGVTVRLMAPPAKGHHKGAEATGEKPKRPAPVAETKTDDSGKFKLEGVPAGTYAVAAGSKTAGMGREKVTVTAGSDSEVSITLKARGEKPAGHEKGEGHKKHKKKAAANDENN